MHKIFGEKKNVEYVTRKGAYIIPFENSKAAVIKTPKGLFLIGGGIENGESDRDCIKRECIEETGCNVCVGELICTAEAYTEHPVIGHFHPVQRYYSGRLTEKLREPTESDHTLVWMDINSIKGRMFAEMQNFAIDELLKNK